MENEALQDREHRQRDRELDGAGAEEVFYCHHQLIQTQFVFSKPVEVGCRESQWSKEQNFAHSTVSVSSRSRNSTSKFASAVRPPRLDGVTVTVTVPPVALADIVVTMPSFAGP